MKALNKTGAGGKRRLRMILPFLQTLRELKPTQRQILLAHIDIPSCEILYETIANVLSSERVSVKTRRRLKKTLAAHKKCLRVLVNKKKSHANRRKKLYSIAGSPLALVSAIVIFYT